jgi:uncharacterized repeat protein (TIGR01451 family)
LSVAIGDLSPAAVVYAGGNQQLDLALQLVGLRTPLTVGQLAQRFPELALKYGIGGVTVSGSAAVDFAASPGDCVGNVGTSCNASSTFKPTQLGARQATITPSIRSIVLAGGGIATSLATSLASLFESHISARLAFEVIGTGTAPITVAPTSVAFGDIEKGTTSRAVTVTVTSRTTVPVRFLAARIDGPMSADFALSADGVSGQTLMPGGSFSATVAGRPTRRGDVNAVLHLMHDAPLSPVAVALTGKGTAPAVASPMQPLDFGASPVSVATPERPVELLNSGDAALRVTGFAISGRSAGSFAVADNNCMGAVILPGSRGYITVSFTPAAPVSHEATLRLVANEATAPFALALRGGGVPAADLAVYLAVDHWHVAAGGRFAYTVTARNSGPNPAIGTVVSLRLPRVATFVSADKPCSSPPVGSTGTVVRRIASLAIGASDVMMVTVQVGAVPNARMRAVAHVRAATMSVNGQNESTAVITVTDP